MTPPLDDAALIAEFTKRKSNQLVAFLLCAVGATVALFAALAVAGPLGIGSSPVWMPLLILGLMVVPIGGMASYTRRNWCCPACGGRLQASDMGGGLRYSRRAATCPHCARQLTAS